MSDLTIDLEKELRDRVNGIAIGVLESLVAGLRLKDPAEVHTVAEFTDFLEACVGDIKALYPEAMIP